MIFEFFNSSLGFEWGSGKRCGNPGRYALMFQLRLERIGYRKRHDFPRVDRNPQTAVRNISRIRSVINFFIKLHSLRGSCYGPADSG